MTLPMIVPANGGLLLIGFSSALIPLTIMAVALRLWARGMKNKKLQLNDYLIVMGAVLAVGNAILTILGNIAPHQRITVLTTIAVVYGGVGYPQIQVMYLYPTLAKIVLALALVWTLANTFVKLSIIHLYWTIFRSKTFQYCVFFVVFLTTGYCITNIVQNLLTCKPIAFNWDKTIEGGTCSTQQAPFLASAIINMCIDVLIFALPLPLLWKLHMDMQKKVSLLIIFGIGFAICIISAVRIHSIANLDYTNFSESVVNDGIYSVIEPCFGVINACLPVLRPIGSRMAESRVFSTLLRTSKTRSTNHQGSTRKLDTFGSSGKKKDFQRIEEGLSFDASTDDQFPLTNLQTVEIIATPHSKHVPSRA